MKKKERRRKAKNEKKGREEGRKRRKTSETAEAARGKRRCCIRPPRLPQGRSASGLACGRLPLVSDVKTDLTLPAFNDRSERAVRFGCVVCQTSGVCENERMAPLNLR